MGIRIEPLGQSHDRAAFSCGQSNLDDWFRRLAGQDDRRNVARVFVAVDDEIGIIGFYSLSSFTISIADLPEEIAKKMPRYDAVPAALIGRLAREERVRGQGIGEILLADAIRRVLAAARSIAIFAIIVDAKDDRAIDFYRRYGFMHFPSLPKRMFLPLATAFAGLEKL